MLNIGPQELLLVLIIALIVVGPTRLPELSRQLGKGLREFRKVQDDVKDMVKLDLSEETQTTKPAARPASPTSPGVHRTPRPAPDTTAPDAQQAPGAAPGSADPEASSDEEPAGPGPA